MRILPPAVCFAAVLCLFAPPVGAQHAPRIARGLEVGPELRFSENVTIFDGIGIAPIAPNVDARAGLGIASPDEGDSEIFLTGGLRSLVFQSTARFPLDIALDAELSLFLFEDTLVQILAGPSLGGPLGAARALIAYVEPLLSFASSGGDSETDFGVRLGADYGLTPTLDLRGDVVVGDVSIGGDTELRIALYFRL